MVRKEGKSQIPRLLSHCPLLCTSLPLYQPQNRQEHFPIKATYLLSPSRGSFFPRQLSMTPKYRCHLHPLVKLPYLSFLFVPLFQEWFYE
jgi:hypothetical protein